MRGKAGASWWGRARAAVAGGLRRRARLRPNRIIITGDVFRPAEAGFRSSQAKNTHWFHRLAGAALARATGLPVTVVTWGAGFDTAEFYATTGATPDLAGWAALHDATTLPLDALAQINAAYHDAVVIGFELPRLLKAGLACLGIPWLDFALHPVRFLPDLAFILQTSSDDVFEAALAVHTGASMIEPWAALMKAASARLHAPRLGGASTLLIGQTSYDRAVIRDGRFTNLSTYASALQAHAAAAPLAYKPHPYERGDFGLYSAGIPFHRLRHTEMNIYRLLSADALDRVVVISSSVGYEAPFFDKSVVWLTPPPFEILDRPANAARGKALSVLSGIHLGDFWRQLLRPLLDVTAPDGRNIEFPPNALRMSLRSFWGYNDLTTDAVVEAAAAAALRGGG